jgi:hypothetical protein
MTNDVERKNEAAVRCSALLDAITKPMLQWNPIQEGPIFSSKPRIFSDDALLVWRRKFSIFSVWHPLEPPPLRELLTHKFARRLGKVVVSECLLVLTELFWRTFQACCLAYMSIASNVMDKLPAQTTGDQNDKGVK